MLATGGIGVSGDAFDARVIDAVVAPALGRGTRYRDEMGGEAPVPAWLYGHLRRWHLLSFLKEESTQRLLDARRARRARAGEDRAARHASSTTTSACRCTARSRARRSRLSSAQPERASRCAAIDLDLPVTRADFDAGSTRTSTAIDGVLDDVLARAGVAAGEIDRVFATGGSSLVPGVRGRLAARFGEDRLVGGEELTSVAWGLAARARQLWG